MYVRTYRNMLICAYDAILQYVYTQNFPQTCACSILRKANCFTTGVNDQWEPHIYIARCLTVVNNHLGQTD